MAIINLCLESLESEVSQSKQAAELNRDLSGSTRLILDVRMSVRTIGDNESGKKKKKERDKEDTVWPLEKEVFHVCLATMQ